MSVSLDLSAIADALHTLQSRLPQINTLLSSERQPLVNEVVDNMVAGYALVDRLVGSDTDLTALGNSQSILELNLTVLYGPADERNSPEAGAAILASERYFYEKSGNGIGDVMDFLAETHFADVWHKAAGLYIRMMATPQLFIEGNHRTGTLLMSYLLMRHGKPPFVVNSHNAVSYFELSAPLKSLKRRSLRMRLRRHRLQRVLVDLLHREADKHFLVEVHSPNEPGKHHRIPNGT